MENVPLSKIEVWQDAEARDLDPEGTKELADSIQREGLQNPPLVQKSADGKYRLVAGQRRLEALKRLGARSTPVTVMRTSSKLEDAKASSIIENLHRKQMSSSELAEACDFLAGMYGSKRKAAKALGLSVSTFRSYQGYKSVPESLKEFVRAKKLTRGEVTRIFRTAPNEKTAIEIAERIATYPNVNSRRRYLDALEEDPQADHQQLKRMARHFREKQNVRFKLSKQHAKGLARASRDHNLEPNELVNKIVKDWLSRRKYVKSS